jgi:c-di-GMP-binding flagellar brake protein YcgR
MDDRRKFLRFSLQLSARYTEQNEDNWKECSVVDISREGMGVVIHSIEAINKGTLLTIEIHAPMQDDPIMIEGKLVWLREIKDVTPFNYAGGVQLTSISPENKWSLIDYAYEGWNKGEKK